MLRQLAFLSLFFICIASRVFAQNNPPPDRPAIIVLGPSGSTEFKRPEWTGNQAVLPGTILNANQDVIFPDPNAPITVLCPNGSVENFGAGELVDGDIVRCPTGTTLIGEIGQQRPGVRRGGKQSPTIPYLISPRNTAVRTPVVELRWNALPNVQHYTILVREASTVIFEAEFDPAEVEFETHDLLTGNTVTVAQTTLDYPLQQAVAYTVEICVLFDDLRAGCTSDPGWQNATPIAFYYVPTPDTQAAAIIADLGETSAESYFARAVLLSQPILQVSPPDGAWLGLYWEALSLLERLLNDHPDSPLAQSPELYNLLGELYVRVELPISATNAFARAASLAQPHTEAAAIADLGQAATTPNGSLVVGFYNTALTHSAGFLTPAAFESQFENLCRSIGATCLQLERCQNQMEQCTAWVRET